MTVGKGTKSGKLLREFIERIENIRERKKELGNDEKAIFAEAVAGGFQAKTMRKVMTLRQQKPEERQEAETMLDTYLHAIGMKEEPPLFAALGKVGVDLARKEEAVEFIKKIVPHGGELVLKLGGLPIRVYRDADGNAHAEEVDETVEPSVKARKRAAASEPEEESYSAPGTARVLPKSAVDAAVERAEAASKAKRLQEAAALDARRAAEAKEPAPVE